MSISFSASVMSSNCAMVAGRPNVALQPFAFRFCYLSAGFVRLFAFVRASGFGFWGLGGFGVARVFCPF
jgi:hypothetical protein